MYNNCNHVQQACIDFCDYWIIAHFYEFDHLYIVTFICIVAGTKEMTISTLS